MIPQLERYILSFFIITLFWISYHQIFNHLRRSYIVIVYLNLIFLLPITFLPIITSLIISIDTHHISYVIYFIVVIINSGLMLLIWWYVLHIKAVSENTNPLYKKGMLVQHDIILIIFSFALLIVVGDRLLSLILNIQRKPIIYRVIVINML